MDNIEFGSFVMILDLMIWSPVIVGLILLLIGKNATSLSYWLSLTTSLLVFGMSMYAYILIPNTSNDVVNDNQ